MVPVAAGAVHQVEAVDSPVEVGVCVVEAAGAGSEAPEDLAADVVGAGVGLEADAVVVVETSARYKSRTCTCASIKMTAAVNLYCILSLSTFV